MDTPLDLRDVPGGGAARRVSVLDRAACLARLAGTSTGRVAFAAADGTVTVLPVTFALDGDDVVFRTSTGSELERCARAGGVTFQADEADVLRRTGWSVMVVGPVSVTRAGAADAEVPGQGVVDALEPWAPGCKDVYVRIGAERVTGRHIGAPGEADGTAVPPHGAHAVWQVASRTWATPFDGR